jgi:hypothetical protein
MAEVIMSSVLKPEQGFNGKRGNGEGEGGSGANQASMFLGRSEVVRDLECHSEEFGFC